MTRGRRMAWLTTAALVGGLVGCAPGPKPAAFLQFELLRATPEVPSMKAAAPRIWRASNNYYRLAFEAWEDGDDDESKEYALLGTILFHTAREMGAAAALKAELSAFNEQLTEGKKIRDDWASKREAKEQAVSALMGELQAANKLDALEVRRQAEQAQMKAQMAKDHAINEIRQRHTDLMGRLKESEAINASRHAAGDYNRAKNLLNKAGYEIEDGRLGEATATLESAATAITTTLETARPKYEVAHKKEVQAEEDQAVIAEAHTLGADGVRVEPRGAVIVVNGLFKGKKTTILPNKRLVLDRIGALILEHSGYKIIIEGHTSDRGKDDANLTLSQAWGNAVAGHFVSKGISLDRVQAVGLGESQPLEDNRSKSGRAKNRRIEVVFLFRRN